jgi:hypothetical protein
MKLHLLAGAIISVSLSLNAQAVHVDMKPGLWENTFKLNETSLTAEQIEQKEKMMKAMEQMKTQLANMPPEQRKMMEQMMEKQGIKMGDQGLDMGLQNVQISKDGTVVKSCITQADIDRGEMPKTQENCEQNTKQVSATVIKTSFTCSGPHPTHGEGEITFQSNKAYTGTMSVTTEMNKKSQTITGSQSGKWLSSDCGNVKPYTPKATAQ